MKSKMGLEFEKEVCKKLRKVERRAYTTIGSGAIFNDHDIKSSAHVCQCKATDQPMKSISISIKDIESLVQLANSSWRDDGIGTKIPLYINRTSGGDIYVTLPIEQYLDIFKEMMDYKEELEKCKEIINGNKNITSQ